MREGVDQVGPPPADLAPVAPDIGTPRRPRRFEPLDERRPAGAVRLGRQLAIPTAPGGERVGRQRAHDVVDLHPAREAGDGVAGVPLRTQLGHERRQLGIVGQAGARRRRAEVHTPRLVAVELLDVEQRGAGRRRQLAPSEGVPAGDRVHVTTGDGDGDLEQPADSCRGVARHECVGDRAGDVVRPGRKPERARGVPPAGGEVVDAGRLPVGGWQPTHPLDRRHPRRR